MDDQFTKNKTVQGKNVKAILNFETNQNETIFVKVGISAVSIDNALQNLTEEIPEWNFDTILNENQSAWKEKLGKVIIDAPEKTKTIFYTALYHSFLAPYLYNDINNRSG